MKTYIFPIAILFILTTVISYATETTNPDALHDVTNIHPKKTHKQTQLIDTIHNYPSADAYYELAMTYQEQRDYLRQMAGLCKALEIDPDHKASKEALNYKVKLMLENPYAPEKYFRVYYLKRGPSINRFLMTYPEAYLDMSDIKDKDIEYVVVNSLMRNDSGKEFLPILEENTYLVKEWSPYKEGIERTSPLEFSNVQSGSFSYRELADRTSSGPVIRLYKVKK